MQICTSLQTDNHASTPPLTFLQAFLSPNSVKALKADILHDQYEIFCSKQSLTWSNSWVSVECWTISQESSSQFRQAKDTSRQLLLRHALSLSLRRSSLAVVNQHRTRLSLHVQVPTVCSDTSLCQPYKQQQTPTDSMSCQTLQNMLTFHIWYDRIGYNMI